MKFELRYKFLKFDHFSSSSEHVVSQNEEDFEGKRRLANHKFSGQGGRPRVTAVDEGPAAKRTPNAIGIQCNFDTSFAWFFMLSG
jgi:hypothetical protein